MAGAMLTPDAGEAQAADAEKVRVALVFLSNSNEHEIWPYPGYDCATRHQEILKALAQGYPRVEFVPVVVPHPADVRKAVALKDSVDGYLVYTVTLNWGLTPTLQPIAIDHAYHEALARFRATLPRPFGGPARRPTVQPGMSLRSNVYPEGTHLGSAAAAGTCWPRLFQRIGAGRDGMAATRDGQETPWGQRDVSHRPTASPMRGSVLRELNPA